MGRSQFDDPLAFRFGVPVEPGYFGGGHWREGSGCLTHSPFQETSLAGRSGVRMRRYVVGAGMVVFTQDGDVFVVHIFILTFY
jgi:hypothetical protein